MIRVAVVLVLAHLVTGPALAAQDASPMPVVPVPEECTATPRPLAAVLALNPSPATTPTPPPTPPVPIPEDRLPTGTPVDAETAAAIAADVRELVACVNAWDQARLLALYSDALVRRYAAEEGPFTAAGYQALATPFPAPPEERTAILAIRGERRLADGRIGAVVVTRIAHPPHDTANFFVFVLVDGRWLLDDAWPVAIPAATPTP
jgi:hypothetical protein